MTYISKRKPSLSSLSFSLLVDHHFWNRQEGKSDIPSESILASHLAKSYQEARTYKILQDDRSFKQDTQSLKLARSSKWILQVLARPMFWARSSKSHLPDLVRFKAKYWVGKIKQDALISTCKNKQDTCLARESKIKQNQSFAWFSKIVYPRSSKIKQYRAR